MTFTGLDYEKHSGCLKKPGTAYSLVHQRFSRGVVIAYIFIFLPHVLL